jgi:hypothetical protein
VSYSIAAAAAAIGLSKTAVLRAIQAGLISGSKNEINEWRVDPAELNQLAKLCRVDGPGSSKRGIATVASIRSEWWFRHTQAKRLAGLAASDQEAQRAARTRWWRLVTAFRRSNSLQEAEISEAETVRRRRHFFLRLSGRHSPARPAA